MQAPFDPDDFAQNDDDAEARFDQYRRTDPLPDVAPALLNTADLLAYIALTGMISPFTADLADPEHTLKPASCAIAAGGTYVYWTDPEGDSAEPRRIMGELGEGETLELERNSIVYVTLAPEFRLPDYIAARFNLKIRDIYRGLLVGTGPLVDPGFTGRLSVPIHNLTSNSYEITGGQPLVWMEFTKLSWNRRWGVDQAPRFPRRWGAGHAPHITRPVTEYVPFPVDKGRRKNIADYLQHANGGQPIRSSIPELVGRTQSSAQEAETQAKKSAGEAEKSAAEASRVRERITRFGVGALIAIVIAIGALIFAGYTVVQSAENTDEAVRASYQQLLSTVADQSAALKAQGAEIARLQSQSAPKR